jgi:hypothetical protein
MNRDRDFDQTLRHWLDDGADQAPERFVWAALDDVERTAQRGAWLAPLEGLFMKLKNAAPYLGVAAAVVLAVAAYQVLLAPNVGNQGPSPSPTPTPRVFTTEDLPKIVFNGRTAPEGMIVDNTTIGSPAFRTPLTPDTVFYESEGGFIDALMTNLDSTETGGYVSWGALFETAADAEAAFDFLVKVHGSGVPELGSEGWGMTRSSADPGLGDESATFTGAAYDIFETNIVHLWRVGNLVLAAVAVGDVAVGEANADTLLAFAELMDERAR